MIVAHGNGAIRTRIQLVHKIRIVHLYCTDRGDTDSGKPSGTPVRTGGWRTEHTNLDSGLHLRCGRRIDGTTAGYPQGKWLHPEGFCPVDILGEPAVLRSAHGVRLLTRGIYGYTNKNNAIRLLGIRYF